MIKRFPLLLTVLVVLPTLFGAVAGAQVITGTVEGRVRDAQGGVLPGVTITALNTATAASFTAVTTSEGLYRVPFLPPGVYNIRAELSGFRTETRQSVEVRVNDSAVVDFELVVGGVTETIVVEGGVSGVQITRSEIKRTYDESALEEIPIATADASGRNVYSVATKAPGVTTPGGRFGRAFLGSGGGNVVANGTTARSTNYELDGISNIDPEDNDYRTAVSVEGVREFEVLTANYNAEFGRAGGAQVRAISKSGTNVFHGSAYEYFYDNQRFQSEATEVQARKCTADQLAGLAPAPAGGCFAEFRTHLFGVTAGGPAIRDRFFYFGMFEDNIRRGNNSSSGTVPLPSERTVNTGSPRGDEIVREWLSLYPMPNREAINPRRYQANVPFAYDTPNTFGRTDYNWSDSTRLMARYDFRNQDYKITRIFRGNGGDIVDRDHNFLTSIDALNALHGADEQFLVVKGEEITERLGTKSLHLNGLDVSSRVTPQGGASVVDLLQRNVDAIRQANGVPHINHPNFGWSISREELQQVRNYRLLEVFNGHPLVNNLGGGGVPGMEEVWDTILSSGARVYGIAVDDAHTFKDPGNPDVAGPGRGWVVVHAARLEARAILDALERGEFYASTGVELADYRANATQVTVTVKATAFSNTGFSSSAEAGDCCARSPKPRPPTCFAATKVMFAPACSRATDESRGANPRSSRRNRRDLSRPPSPGCSSS